MVTSQKFLSSKLPFLMLTIHCSPPLMLLLHQFSHITAQYNYANIKDSR